MHPSHPYAIGEWRENIDLEPKVNVNEIEKHVQAHMNGKAGDLTTFILIEECNSWYQEYSRILQANKLKASDRTDR